MLVLVNIFTLSRQGVESMTSLVQQCFHITLQAHSIHENKRQTRFRKAALIPAGRLAFAVGQIEQTLIPHGLKTRGKFIIYMVKNTLSLGDHILDLTKWLERLQPIRIHRSIPRPQLVQAQL